MKKLTLIALALALAVAPAWAAATVKVLWSPPTLNTDGSAYTDGAGFRVYCGLQPLQYTMTYDVTSATAGSVQVVIPANQGDRWYFAVTALDVSGNESAYSVEASHYFPTSADLNVPRAPGATTVKTVVAP